MTTTATKPRRKYNRQAARKHRRRSRYPSLETLPRGRQGDVERAECGVNKGLAVPDHTGKLVPGHVTSGTYVFERELPKPSCNKYDPQVEDAKRGRRQ